MPEILRLKTIFFRRVAVALYNPGMASDTGIAGISRSGSDGVYVFASEAGRDAFGCCFALALALAGFGGGWGRME